MKFFSKVWNSAKKIEQKATAVIEDTAAYIEESSSKVWKGFTGRAKFEEAEILLENIERSYDEAKKQYEKEITFIAAQIDQKVSKINYHKKDIFDKYFAKFIYLGNRLHNISIQGKNFLEYFDDSIIQVNNLGEVRSKTELYEIDFNNLQFKEIALGVLTLGFSTRKKAKQTFSKVQDEEKRINEEIEKMKAQTVKAKVILESIDNVDEYFTLLIQNYTKLLDRFEYGIKSQVQKNIFKGVLLTEGKLDFKMMPVAHIEEFQALFNLSIVLKQMASLGYLNEEGEINDEDIKSVEKIQKMISSNELIAA
ncbi:MAG: DNA repair protein [Candidatus Altimarinota bacterium]